MYRAGEDATEVLARNALVGIMNRVTQDTERQLRGARQALNVLAPDAIRDTANAGASSLIPFPRDDRALEERLWLATNVVPDDTSYVYYAGVDGSFLGIKQLDLSHFRISRRDHALGPNRIYFNRGPGTTEILSSSESYEPRERPWYKSAVAANDAVWSPVFTDFRSRVLGITLSKPVFGPGHSLIGVANSSIGLWQIAERLQKLPLNRNGVVFIMERDGRLIGTSAKEPAYRVEGQQMVRLGAAEMNNDAIRTVSQVVLQALHGGPEGAMEALRKVDMPQGAWAVSASRLHSSEGLEWIVVAALPRSDFLGSVTNGIYQTVILGLASLLLTFLAGVLILRWVLRDIRKLTQAAKSIGNGEPFPALNIERRDEIGQLAQSFQEMERNLRTDRLTNVLNRDSLAAQIDFRRRNATAISPLYFALLFIDLDKFKSINDQYGHDEGDRVLVETAANLQRAVRREDAVARFGGDEFVVYLHNVRNEGVAAGIVAKIRASLALPIAGREGALYQIDASIGVALYPQDGLDIETLLRIADARMFEQKRDNQGQ